CGSRNWRAGFASTWLEAKFHRELHDPRIERAGHRSECRRAERESEPGSSGSKGRRRNARTQAGGHIERFPANLERPLLAQTELTRKRGNELPEPRARNVHAAHRAERSNRGRGESRRVDPAAR